MSKWPLDSFCKRFAGTLGVRDSLIPVRDQQQISKTRKAIRAFVLLMSVSNPRPYRLRTRSKSSQSRPRLGHPFEGVRVDDLLKLNITKQIVQMHSTATDVGTLTDRQSRLARILLKFNFRHNSTVREEHS